MQVFNQFTEPVDLLDKMLDLPILEKTKTKEAHAIVHDRKKAYLEALASEGKHVGASRERGTSCSGSSSPRASASCSSPRGLSKEPLEDSERSSDPAKTDGNGTAEPELPLPKDDKWDTIERELEDELKKQFGFKPSVNLRFFVKLLLQSSTPQTITLKRAVEYFVQEEQAKKDAGIRDSLQGSAHMRSHTSGKEAQQPLKLQFLHPLVFQKLGDLIVDGYEGTFNTQRRDRSVPLDVAAYSKSMQDLSKCSDSLLDSIQWLNMRPLFKLEEKEKLFKATAQKKVAFDMVLDVLEEYGPAAQLHDANPKRALPYVRAIYAARANPTKWQPWTKPNHRREMKGGVWICKKAEPVPQISSQVEYRRQVAENYWNSRKRIALLLQDKKTAHFFDDDGATDDITEDPEDLNLDDYQLLATHLGKAGGLNFGMNAVVMKLFEKGDEPPSESCPMFYGIIDARHSVDQRFWEHVMPAFFFKNERAVVSFQKDIALVQIAHSYLGMTHKTDPLDMRNDFLFTGMAVIRNQCYGMTSCGTGGIWAITRSHDLENYFYGRTMIEDTASSTQAFLNGYKSVYVAPFANKESHDQLMCAVPKIGANYLEALERWDTGAVQCLCAQGLPSRWFWICFPMQLLTFAMIIYPAWTKLGVVLDLTSPSDLFDHLGDRDVLVCLVPAAYWLILLIVFVSTALCSPKTTNWLLRFLILLFNHTYPLNSVASVFWVIIPAWICIAGSFPFTFDPIFAICGSLVLRLIEWMIVLKMKGESERVGTSLKEFSIFRSQQMNMVTVPIKLRAVMKGFQTGYADVFGKKDNSFWISFGTAQAVIWVQLWLCSVLLLMVISIVVALVHIFMNMDDPHILVCCLFGMALAIIQFWMMLEPAMAVMKGRSLKLSLRHTEVAVLIAIGLAVVFMSQVRRARVADLHSRISTLIPSPSLAAHSPGPNPTHSHLTRACHLQGERLGIFNSN